MSFALTSRAFRHEGDIPDHYTCVGENVSPPLNWSDPPDGTRSFALIAEDLDTPVGTITHWVLYNIPPESRHLPEALPHRKSFPDGTVQGRNGMRRSAYMGPCPPWGKHRYLFRIFALDIMLKVDARMTKKKLLKAMANHILGESALMGHYSKAKSS
jgi:Raf kinase inhibitor-like YbhB/YbcL family protein